MTRITSYTDATQHRKAGPYSPVLRISAGDLIVISGQGPLNDDGELIGSNIAEQTRATLANSAKKDLTRRCCGSQPATLSSLVVKDHLTTTVNSSAPTLLNRPVRRSQTVQKHSRKPG